MPESMFTHFLITTLLSVLLSAQSVKSSDAIINPITTLPNEALAHILAFAYIDYDDPVEFTRLKSVCTAWHAIINEPFFKKSCAAKGFAEPVMVFHVMSVCEENQSDFLKNSMQAKMKRSESDAAWNEYKDTVQFHYIDPKDMAIEHPFNGFFWEKQCKHCAAWVNPTKTYVFNRQFDMHDKDAENFSKSKMSVAQYKALYEKGKILKAETMDINMELFMHCTTGEPFLQHKSILYYGSYDWNHAKVRIPAPVSPSRFVKKWPSTTIFNVHQHNAVYPSSNQFEQFGSFGF